MLASDVGYLTALRMDRRAARPEAGRREAMHPELMEWQREWWGGVVSKIWRRQNSESIGHCLKGKRENGSKECMMWPQFPTWSSGGIVVLLIGVQEGSSLSWERGNLVYLTSHGYLNLYSDFFPKAIIVTFDLRTHLVKIKHHLYYPKWMRCRSSLANEQM